MLDRTDWPFVTLDPATSTDLDQAFHIEMAGSDVLLHYAIADVAWFVDDGGPLDDEAWQRGATQYLPDGKAGSVSASARRGCRQPAARRSRPAVVFHVRVDADGQSKLDGVERSLIRSRAKFAYETVQPAQLPEAFPELARRIAHAEEARGAARIEPLEQEVHATGSRRLRHLVPPAAEVGGRQRRDVAGDQSGDRGRAASLPDTGLFRVMPEPDARAEQRLRHTARALGIEWPAETSLRDFERTLNGKDPKPAALLMAIRRAGGGASYVPFAAGERPWHSAMAATYVHATAPLRRLADRYVVMADARQSPTVNRCRRRSQRRSRNCPR